MNNKMKKTNGFTLIELMIVVAIVGILASIAIPSYQKSILKSRRADARSALLGFANALERHFTENFSYCGAGSAGAAGGVCGVANNTGTPTIFAATSPVESDGVAGTTAYYILIINAVTPTTFTISAIPIAPQDDDDCGTLVLNSLLVKTMPGASAGMTVADCW